MKHLPYLLPVAVLIIRRHAAAAMIADALGHPPRYLVVALGTWTLMAVAVLVGLACGAVLLVNDLRNELPANRRKKARP